MSRPGLCGAAVVGRVSCVACGGVLLDILTGHLYDLVLVPSRERASTARQLLIA